MLIEEVTVSAHMSDEIIRLGANRWICMGNTLLDRIVNVQLVDWLVVVWTDSAELADQGEGIR